MRELELLTLVAQSAVHEEWEAMFGSERAIVRRTTIAADASALETFTASVKNRPEVFDTHVEDGKVQLIERRPRGRRLEDLNRTLRSGAPADVACAFGLELIAELVKDQALTLDADAHGALDPRCVFVSDDGRPAIVGFGFGRLTLQLLGEPERSDAAQVRYIVTLLCPALDGALGGPHATLGGLSAALGALARAPDGTPALGPWVQPSSPLARLLDVPKPSSPRRQTALARPRAEGSTADGSEETWTSDAETDSTAARFEPAVDLEPPSWTGQVIEGYRLEHKLGSGSFGVVYFARNPETGEECAFKAVHSARSPRLRARLLREAQAASLVRHPNLIEVLQCGEHEGVPYLRMKYVAGSNLRELIRREAPLDAPRAARLMRQLALALAAIHRAGTVHRDIKPANILISRELSGEALTVTDFGVARLDSTELTRLTGGEALGTPLYMAPEQASSPHEAGPAADMYSAGVILYELIEGHPPFRGGALPALVAAHASAPPTPPDDAQGLGPIAMALLSKDPMLRPSAERVAQLIEETEAFRSASEATSLELPERTQPPTRAPAPSQRGTGASRAAPLFALVTALGGAVVLLLVLTTRARQPSEPPTAPLAPSVAVGAVPIPSLTPAREIDTGTTAPTSVAPRPAPAAPRPQRSKPAAPPFAARVDHALALRGLERADLELLPELARQVDALERAMARPEELAELEATIARHPLDRRFLQAKLDRLRRRIRAQADHLPAERFESLERSYMDAATKLQRASAEPELSQARQLIDVLARDVRALE